MCGGGGGQGGGMARQTAVAQAWSQRTATLSQRSARPSAGGDATPADHTRRTSERRIKEKERRKNPGTPYRSTVDAIGKAGTVSGGGGGRTGQDKREGFRSLEAGAAQYRRTSKWARRLDTDATRDARAFTRTDVGRVWARRRRVLRCPFLEKTKSSGEESTVCALCCMYRCSNARNLKCIELVSHLEKQKSAPSKIEKQSLLSKRVSGMHATRTP